MGWRSIFFFCYFKQVHLHFPTSNPLVLSVVSVLVELFSCSQSQLKIKCFRCGVHPSESVASILILFLRIYISLEKMIHFYSYWVWRVMHWGNYEICQTHASRKVENYEIKISKVGSSYCQFPIPSIFFNWWCYM